MTSIQHERLAAATRHLQEKSLDGLIAASNGLNNFLDPNAVFVLSGVRPIGESAVVLDRQGRSVLIVTPEWDQERASSISATGKTVGTRDLPGAIADAVSKPRHWHIANDIGRVISARPRHGQGDSHPPRRHARDCRRAHQRPGEGALDHRACRRQARNLDSGARIRAAPRIRQTGNAGIRAGGGALLLHEAARRRGQLRAHERLSAQSGRSRGRWKNPRRW